jgi:hypothetical protein
MAEALTAWMVTAALGTASGLNSGIPEEEQHLPRMTRIARMKALDWHLGAAIRAP